MSARTAQPKATILYDGVCALCNGSVRLIIANDPSARFRFAALQSDAGRALLHETGGAPQAPASLIFIDADGRHDRSEAALRIAAGMRAPWNWLSLLRGIPRRARDPFYDFIALNRYRWFGRYSQCVVSPPQWRERFLD